MVEATFTFLGFHKLPVTGRHDSDVWSFQPQHASNEEAKKRGGVKWRQQAEGNPERVQLNIWDENSYFSSLLNVMTSHTLADVSVELLLFS